MYETNSTNQTGTRNGLYSGLIVGGGLTLLTLAGCASRGQVGKLESDVSALASKLGEVKGRVERVERSPHIGAGKYFTLTEDVKKGYANELREFLRKVVDRIKDPKAREYARRHANAVFISPAHGGYVLVNVVHDNGDGIPTRADRDLGEQRGGVPVTYLVPVSWVPDALLR